MRGDDFLDQKKIARFRGGEYFVAVDEAFGLREANPAAERRIKPEQMKGSPENEKRAPVSATIAEQFIAKSKSSPSISPAPTQA